MTATMPRPATRDSANPSFASLPVGQNHHQAKRRAEPRILPLGGLNVPQQHDQPQSDAQNSRGMLLWDPLLQTLASGLDDIEASRTAQANRLRVLTKVEADADGELRGFGLDAGHPTVAALQSQLDALWELEKGMAKALAEQLKTHPLHPWIKAQRGLGDKQVARLLAAIRDPYWNDLHDRPRTVSELWAFCGLHVLPASQRTAGTKSAPAGGSNCGGGDTSQREPETQYSSAGVAPVRARGQKMNWNNEARSRIYLIAKSCLRNRQSPYRPVYDDGRTKYADTTHPAECKRCGPAGKPAQPGTPLSLGHQHARAMRLVMKTILKDLWIESKPIYEAADRGAAA